MAKSGDMITIGLTGSIGMGKSTVAAMFADLGAVVWDADAADHRLYGPGGAALKPLAARFPGVVSETGVDRTMLAASVLDDPAAMKDLEALVHPLVARDRAQAMEKAAADGAAVFVVDIPLLFETGAEAAFDYVVVVSAPASVQRARVLARPGMTTQKFDAILRKQTPDAEKRARADFVVETDRPLSETREAVSRFWRLILDRQTTRH